MPEAADQATPEQRIAASMLAATLLAFSGGVLDAFLYVAHGKVFAGAMTGNAILLGIALLGRHRVDIAHHAVPLIGFVVGVWLSEIVGHRVKEHAVTFGLALEAAGLALAALLPRNCPDPVFTFFVPLVAAFQVTSFRSAESYSYNSTFITGDLRACTVAVYKALHPGTRGEAVRQARDFGLIIASFVAGAVTGAILGQRTGNFTLLLPMLAVLVVFAMALRASRHHVQQTAEDAA